MNAIDISSWQKGIDLAALYEKNSLNVVVCKATEGEKITTDSRFTTEACKALFGK